MLCLDISWPSLLFSHCVCPLHWWQWETLRYFLGEILVEKITWEENRLILSTGNTFIGRWLVSSVVQKRHDSIAVLLLEKSVEIKNVMRKWLKVNNNSRCLGMECQKQNDQYVNNNFFHCQWILLLCTSTLKCQFVIVLEGIALQISRP